MSRIVVVLGPVLLLQACATPARVPNTSELALVNDLSVPLIAEIHPPPKACMAVLRTDDINAAVGFVPEGDENKGCTHTLVVTEGAIRSLSAAELQAILAHELAHYTLGHLEQYESRHQITRAIKAFFLVVSQITLVGSIVGNVGSLATEIVSNAYSREDESAADLEGARLLRESSAHWQGLRRPSGCGQMVEALTVLRRHSGDQGWADYLGDHPALPTRISAVQAFCREDVPPHTPAEARPKDGR